MMSLGRAMLRFFFLAAIGHQLSCTFVEGGIFEPARRRLSTVHPRLDEFVHQRVTWKFRLCFVPDIEKLLSFRLRNQRQPGNALLVERVR